MHYPIDGGSKAHLKGGRVGKRTVARERRRGDRPPSNV